MSAAEQGWRAEDAAEPADVSHNLLGQKLGRKGRITRERILAATAELLAESPDTPISLSAVARRASLGMTSLYLYFSDLTELLLAVLKPIMERTGEPGGHIDLLREYWPDAELDARCRAFIEAYYAFWTQHSRILHLRNSMADQYDERMIGARIRSARPMIGYLRSQLVVQPEGPTGPLADDMASVLITGIERAVTVATDPITPNLIARQFGPRHTNVVDPLARLVTLAVRDCRAGNPT